MSTTELSLSCRSPQVRKLNLLRWAASARFTLVGVRIGLRANALEFLDPLISRIPSVCGDAGPTPIDRLYSVIGDTGTSDDKKRRGRNILFANGRRLASGASWGEICDAFEANLEFFLATRSRGFLFVHAGAVSWRGQAIVIPGESHSGKTTLVQAFLELGATYYSDEYAVLDPEGQLHPFPRALRVRGSLPTTTKVPAAKFDAPTGILPAQVRLVILTRHVSGSCWKPKALSQGEGILGMIQNTLAARRYPKLALSTLQRATQGADVLGGVRGEAKDTARWALQHLRR